MPTLLETAELREAGIPEPWEFGVGDKVRFTELDPLGHVNNSKYFSWFEDFRLFYLPRFGLPMLAKDGARLVLADVGCTFLAEMVLHDDYVTCGRVRELGVSSFTMEFAVFRLTAGETPVKTVTSHAVIAMRKPDGSGKFVVPDDVRRSMLNAGATER